MKIRSIKSSDYYQLSPVINEWWNGRNMTHMVPKLFFDHFGTTSFCAEDNGKIVGFLIGFLSQDYIDEGYIHFSGVHPEYRQEGIGRRLYQHFFDRMKYYDRSIVCCITSPVNKNSIAYHKKMGFETVEGDKRNGDIWICSNYSGPGEDKVLFKKELT